MINRSLVPYETIVRATKGEPDAVLRHYSRRIQCAAFEDGQVDKDAEDSIKRKLITALLQFRLDW